LILSAGVPIISACAKRRAGMDFGFLGIYTSKWWFYLVALHCLDGIALSSTSRNM
jgi:hypothetical protein